MVFLAQHLCRVSWPSMRKTPSDSPTRSVDVVRVASGERRPAADTAVVEEPLQVVINGARFAVIMRTPGADRDLAAGFLLGERIVIEREELKALEPARARDGSPQHNVIEITLAGAAVSRLDSASRAVTTNASCGLCGRQSIDNLVAHGVVIRSDLTVSTRTLVELPRRMREGQAVFDRTGGLHAAALFRSGGELLDIAEDVGRHNAVDKIVGARWLAGDWPLGEYLLCVSGRLSYEIVLKALVAGIPLIAAVSAPSTLAIDLAQTTGITLAGFVRDGRMNVYTHPTRII
jgi:FdhD protein